MNGRAYPYPALEQYVGKTFYEDFTEIKIEMLLGGESGPPFFLCIHSWSGYAYCAEPSEVLPHFDDSLKPIKDFPEL